MIKFYSPLHLLPKQEITTSQITYREHQKPVVEAWNNTKDYISIAVCRRAGKDYIVFHLCVKQCLENPNTRISYFFPTIKQGVSAIFEGITLNGQNWLETIVDREQLTTPRSNGKLYHSDNTLRFKNGSIIRIFGADKAETKVGSNEHVVVFSEASHMPKFKLLLNRMIPSVSQVGGRIVVVSTPCYGSDFNDLMSEGYKDGWFKQIVPATEAYDVDGSPLYSEQELARNRSNMSYSEFQQEYQCDMSVANEMSIYGQSFSIGKFASTYDDLLPNVLYVSFDLGKMNAYLC